LHRQHFEALQDPAGTTGSARRLALVLALTAVYAAAEVIGGWLANSLALLADAGHMLTDIMALSLALLASWVARRPPDEARTYGYQRTEILAALVNGVALITIALFILLEAWRRFQAPLAVEVHLMAGVAAGGLVVNLAAAWILRGKHRGLNFRAAYLHVLGDLLGSVGALTAAGSIAWFGWRWADPAASVVIACIIIVSAARLVLASLHVLMEGVPAHLKIEEVRDSLLKTPGVGDVHDLHLWSLGGRTPLLTAHLVLDHSAPAERVLRQAARALRRRFGITHSTLQIEPPDFNIASGPRALDGGFDEEAPSG
jgi:cobalt-zinc-cadmium efflux system protein